MHTNLKDMMPRERCQIEIYMFYDSVYTNCPEEVKADTGRLAAWGRDDGGTAVGTLGATVAQLCECDKNMELCI